MQLMRPNAIVDRKTIWLSFNFIFVVLDFFLFNLSLFHFYPFNSIPWKVYVVGCQCGHRTDRQAVDRFSSEKKKNLDVTDNSRHHKTDANQFIYCNFSCCCYCCFVFLSLAGTHLLISMTAWASCAHKKIHFFFT